MTLRHITEIARLLRAFRDLPQPGGWLGIADQTRPYYLLGEQAAVNPGAGGGAGGGADSGAVAAVFVKVGPGLL